MRPTPQSTGPAALRAALAVALLAAAASARADAPEADAPAEAAPFEIAGERVEPGSTHRLALAASESFAGTAVSIPILVAHGRLAGPTLCLTAGVHGDEINGVEAVRSAVEGLDPEALRGTVVAVPIVNLHGFRRGSRYLPDRRDLNRHFPGRQRGSAASRIAHAVFDGMVRRCDALLDFHTGSFQRDNLPHARGNLSNPGVRQLAESLDGWLVLDHRGTEGTLRRAATDAGIPTLTFEVGGPYRVEPDAVVRGVAGARAVLAHLGIQGKRRRARPEIVPRARWVRVDDGGLLFTHVALGERVKSGAVLGMVVDPIENHRNEVRAPAAGRVIGMAWPQVVIPGFAAFHLALSGGAGADSEIETQAPGDGASEVEPEDRPE